MTSVDQLIKQLCPGGVELKTLGEIGELVRGNGLPKTDFTDTGVGAIHYGQIYTHYGAWAAKTISFVAPETAARLAKVDPGDVIITNTSENLQDVGKAVAWLGASQIVTGGHATVLKHSQNPKFLAYWLQTPDFFTQNKRFATGTKVIDVPAKALEKVRLPIPPLEVQDAVVRQLDRFHALEAELESHLRAELDARRAQYVYYRDALMAFTEDGVPKCPMGKLATIVRGASPRPIKHYMTDAEDGVPWIKIGDSIRGSKYITSTRERVTPEGAAKSRRVQPGDFVLSNSMSFGRPYISKIEGCIHDGWLAISEYEASFLPDFMYHLLGSAPVQGEFARRAGAGTVRNLNADIVKAVTVPVPPMAEQRRIVAILDKFEALVNDLSIALPAELEARRAQYEHYRDRLLTFPEAVA